ncbi:hypothetical protein DTL21_25830 [Bremerella cremea]|uniref:Uncharacterized protein n=1 Tax=Blastopirellula marina TaxID=124 RepID=A0A2S8FBC6_9BACT|nr:MULTISPECIES: hypothetical protein [Pirellulaceae]PQO29478.1 hypothetical protein C5Y83_25785 [Blastopirellula marina]RCS42782.1 hypothetical protein DTL21_25830 [Bremerella cremea]
MSDAASQGPGLDVEEYIEQQHFFQGVQSGLDDNRPMQDILKSMRDEILVTTKLPMAIDYLAAELRHSGLFYPAMKRLAHYFTGFQTFIVESSEDDRGKFDFLSGLEILKLEAKLRAEHISAQSLFLYQFETICRHRLKYDQGFAAMASDPMYDEHWRRFLEINRRRVGLIDIADMIYTRSEHYITQQIRRGGNLPGSDFPPLFGEREGRIALANRKRDPLLLFSALQRQMGYPKVPVKRKVDEAQFLIPQMMRRMERLEARIKLLEDENRGGIDLTKFYQSDKGAPNFDDFGD